MHQTPLALIYLSPGLGFACVLAFGRQVLPGIVLGTLVTGMWRDVPHAWVATTALLMPLQALVCARLLHAERPFAHIATKPATIQFFMVTMVVAPLVLLVPSMVLSFLTVAWLPPVASTATGPVMIAASWLGIAFGVALMAPAVLVLSDRNERVRLRETPGRTITFAVILPVLASVGLLVPGLAPLLPTLALPIPAAVLALAALQLPSSGVALASAILACTSLTVRAQSVGHPPTLPLEGPEVLGFWAAATLCILTLSMVSILAERESLQRSMDDERRRSLALLARRAEFFAVLSHELRTPLNSVLLAVDLLIESTLDDEQRDLAETVARAGGSLRTLIDASLDLSRAESGRLEIHARPVSLPLLLDDVAVVLGEAARRRGLTLRPELGPDTSQPFVTDPNLLRRVLLNLVGNAVKYGSPGEVVLRARTELLTGSATDPDSPEATIAPLGGPRETPASRLAGLRIEIEDDGPGIPAERQAEIFEPFARLDEDKLDRAVAPVSGSGLGLAITRELVRRLGGRIGVRSRPRQPGTIFWLVLPPLPEDTSEASA